MRIVYIRETEETCDIVKRFMVCVKRIFSIIYVQNNQDKIIYYLPIFKNKKLSKFRIKKISKKISSLLEKDASETIVLSQYLETIEYLKNMLYSENINILNGRYLFKCLTYKVIEYIFKIKNKTMNFRRSFIVN